MKQTSLIQKLEQFFWFFLFVNPFLDILNGIYMKLIAGIGVLDVETTLTSITPTLVIRMLVLLLFGLYLLLIRDTRALGIIAPIGIAWALSLVSEYTNFGAVSLFVDLQYIARFGYNITLLMIFTHVFYNRWKLNGKTALLAELDLLVRFTLLVLSLSILISSLLDIGYHTYADPLGYRGSRGFFYAGNDVTAILILLLPLSMAQLMRSSISAGWIPLLSRALPFALGLITLLVIGSKTAFLGAGVTIAAMFLFAIVTSFRKNRAYLRTVLIVLAVCIVLFGVLLLLSPGLLSTIRTSLSTIMQVLKTEDIANALLSGRQYKMLTQLRFLVIDCNTFAWLFGMGRGAWDLTAEMDVFEVFLYYGLFGLFTMLRAYILLGHQFLRSLCKQFDLTAFALLLSLGLSTGYLFIAGHVLFSVTAGFYYSFVFIYSRVYFAKEEQDIFWKGVTSHEPRSLNS